MKATLMMEELGLRRADDALTMLFGDEIGRGEYRIVYSCNWSSGTVLKVERGDVSNAFANVNEWTLWCEAKGTWAEKWLAPCWQISPCGLVLVQSKCEPLEARPKKVPSFLADCKRVNWGMFEGRPVAFDYANHKTFQLGITKRKSLVKPHWHDLAKKKK